jgi:hypothetical protein
MSQLYNIATADLDEYKTDYKRRVEPILEEIQHVEESRINFIKYTLEKFYRHQAKLHWDKKAGDMVEQLAKIDSAEDIKMFVEANRSSLQAS